MDGKTLKQANVLSAQIEELQEFREGFASHNIVNLGGAMKPSLDLKKHPDIRKAIDEEVLSKIVRLQNEFDKL